MTTLVERVRALLNEAGATVPPDEAAVVADAARRLDEPLRVAVAGRIKAGKSTLLNALVGEAVAATDATECTTIVTWYRNGPTYEASVRTTDGGRSPVRFVVDDDRAWIDLGERDVDAVDRLEVEFPSLHLSGMTLIDTPGVASISESVAARTTAFLTPTSGDDGADVVVYLLRHLHQSDTDFLEAFTERTGRDVDPVRSVGVLARADEIGNGRGDSLELAQEVARRYATDSRLSGRVSTVVPVSGLLAFAAATMRQHEFDTLAALAAMPVHELDLLTVSADRFRAESATCPVRAPDRSRVLSRLGLFGVRLAVACIQDGATTSSALGERLDRASGIGPLRTLLLERFASRADVIKAARALDVLQAVVSRHGRAVPQLAIEVERLFANAHELRELHLLRAVQAGEVPVPEATLAIVVQSLGGEGARAATRVGVSSAASADEIRTAASARLGALRTARTAPLLHPEVTSAYEAAIRSIEQVLADLP